MENTTVALIYDFDKTLSTTDMQEYTFIPSLNMTADEFWTICEKTAHANNMDTILAALLTMVNQYRKEGMTLSREVLQQHGKNVAFHKGVERWFQRITEYGAQLGLNVKHYIISSGLKPMIEGCKIAKNFERIFACDFVYDENGNPIWPSVSINYSSKIQFIYRISKGVLDVYENDKLNMRTPPRTRAVPFRNIVYIGDGLTDVPSMKLTRLNGGYAVGVYQNAEDGKYLVKDDRVDFYVKADYSEGSKMDTVVKAILRKIHAVDEIIKLSDKS